MTAMRDLVLFFYYSLSLKKITYKNIQYKQTNNKNERSRNSEDVDFNASWCFEAKYQQKLEQ